MQFNFFKRKNSLKMKPKDINEKSDLDFLKARTLFKEQRINLGFSLNDLANNTKISKNVLLAIENGWNKYIPENTYLTSMLRRLESILELESNSLNGLLSEKESSDKVYKFQFNLLNIGVFSTWKGNLLYILILLICILFINRNKNYIIPISNEYIDPILLKENPKEEIKIITKSSQ